MNLSTKDLPKCDQPYEKCKQYGITSLSDSELLAVIIRSGTKTCNAIDLARMILNKNPIDQTIAGLNQLSLHELKSITGIGDVKAIQIMALCEFSKRMSKQNAMKHMRFTDPKSIASVYMERMRHLKHEEVVILLFDTKHALIKELVMTIGTINASLTSPREIFIEALKYEAVYIILLHNHPSGDATPSKEDIGVTNRLANVGNLLGIQLSDHIIIGDRTYTSLKERGLY